MPKQKTHKGAKKRFRVTKNGKVKRWKAGRRHKLSGKTSQRRRHLRKPGMCEPMDRRKVRELLGSS
ncbi:MAG: 50S ribosomal protein L35 [Planctomycetota bacterium]|nr:50S ribosomal protein L35 [Planctomycetota bacterium]